MPSLDVLIQTCCLVLIHTYIPTSIDEIPNQTYTKHNQTAVHQISTKYKC